MSLLAANFTPVFFSTLFSPYPCFWVFSHSSNVVLGLPSIESAPLGAVTIADNASGSPHVVNLSGTGTAPTVSLSANTLSFADQPVGTTGTAQDVTLTNIGAASLAINSVSVVGDFAQTNDCAATLAASASCTINVQFNPATGGVRAGEVTISYRGSDSQATVSLSGTGTFQLLIPLIVH